MYERNARWAKMGPYQTQLDPVQEMKFREWVAATHAPFDPSQPDQDYDMRGYWADIASKGQSETAINLNDNQTHYPDTYKTPMHQSFSNESKYALPSAPRWINDHQLADPATGQIIFDERARGR